MKKVVLASLLACAVLSLGLSTAFAQTPVQLGSQAAPVQMPDAEYTVYNNAMNQSNPQAKASAIEAYLAAYPNSSVKQDTLVTLMTGYSQFDPAKTLDAADRVLQLDPANLRALTFEAYLRKQNADSLTDPAAKQAALDSAAGFAQKGLAAPKPASIADADFKALQSAAFPVFYSIIGFAAFNKNDNAAAIDAYKKELALVPLAATKTPGSVLQDIFYLGSAYYQSNPPDYLDCAFYASRAVAYAPDNFKAQMSPTATYCYKKYHAGTDGYDAIVAAATANLNPPAGLFASIKPAPTPVDIINGIFQSTPDLATLAVSDKEYVLQKGTPEQAAKVWATIQGKSVQIPGALVISSSPTVLKVAVTDDAIQSNPKTADFTFNMTPPETIPELKANATVAQKAAYKKAVDAAQTKADAIAAATAVGQTVTLTGTYDSFTPDPIQIIMKDGVVILPKANKPAAAPVHHTAAHPAHR
jgi:hypothetical protein